MNEQFNTSKDELNEASKQAEGKTFIDVELTKYIANKNPHKILVKNKK